VSGNNLEFDDLEPNMDLLGAGISLDYTAQRRVGLTIRDTIRVATNKEIKVAVGGSANSYKWKLTNDISTDSVITAATGSTYEITGISYESMGNYTLETTSALVPGLTLTSRTQQVMAFADLTFRAIDLAGSFYINGSAYALRVTVPGKPYDTIQVVEGGRGRNAQAFNFEKLLLGDYLIAVAPKVLKPFMPTYYPSTDLWTEAEEFILRADGIEQLNMTQIPPPLPPRPDGGRVGGVLESDFADDDQGEDENNRVDARRKVKKAGCSMRRFVRAGRIDQEGDFVLYAYVESDDEGRFNFTDIEPGLYRFNIEFPGIPMDPNSFVEFEIGADGKESNSFTLEATITEDGIVVEKIAELGFFRKYFKDLNVYPNPSDKEMHVTYAKMLAKGVVLRLTNLNGQTLYEAPVEPGYNGEISIEVEDMPSGVYLLHFIDTIEGKGTVVTYKVFVKH
ncbi:MAG: hypothetical protein ACJAVY_002184, partial [Marinoscillum sp.]